MTNAQRRKLLQFLLAGPAIYPVTSHAFWFSDDREKRASRQVHSLRGQVTVNGRPIRSDTIIGPGDTIETGEESEIVFSQNRDAHLLRSNTRLTLNNNNGIVDALRLISGAVLSVFGSGNKNIRTPVATIGIRGTGTYFEVTDQETYLCTCYGKTDIASTSDPSVTDSVSTSHHEAPRIIRNTSEGAIIDGAPVKNHSDAELIMLEATVGREPPFVDDPFAGEIY